MQVTSMKAKAEQICPPGDDLDVRSVLPLFLSTGWRDRAILPSPWARKDCCTFTPLPERHNAGQANNMLASLFLRKKSNSSAWEAVNVDTAFWAHTGKAVALCCRFTHRWLEAKFCLLEHLHQDKIVIFASVCLNHWWRAKSLFLNTLVRFFPASQGLFVIGCQYNEKVNAASLLLLLMCFCRIWSKKGSPSFSGDTWNPCPSASPSCLSPIG